MTATEPALRPGEQLASTTCTTRVVVIRAPAGARPRIACGDDPMVPAVPTPRPRAAAGTLIGKRYVNAEETLQLLCTASGAGALSCDGAPMEPKAAKPLPASD